MLNSAAGGKYQVTIMYISSKQPYFASNYLAISFCYSLSKCRKLCTCHKTMHQYLHLLIAKMMCCGYGNEQCNCKNGWRRNTSSVLTDELEDDLCSFSNKLQIVKIPKHPITASHNINPENCSTRLTSEEKSNRISMAATNYSRNQMAQNSKICQNNALF